MLETLQKAWDQIVAMRPSNPQKSDFSHGLDVGLCMAAVVVRQFYEEAEENEDPVEDEPTGEAVLTDLERDMLCKVIDSLYKLVHGQAPDQKETAAEDVAQI